jgi:RND family efflux transporter MFP subunit
MKRTIIMTGLLIGAVIGGMLVGLFVREGVGGTFRAAAGNATVATYPGTPLGNPAVMSPRPRRKILYYWDPMVGPASISPKPGISSMGMQLIPVYAPASGGGTTSGQVRVAPAMVQDMGIQTSRVAIGPLIRLVHTVGYLRVPDPQRYNITLRTGGWIGKLYATTNGTVIRKGQRLFTLYSPQIVAAENELLAAQESFLTARKAGNSGLVKDTLRLRQSVETRLAYLGVNWAQIKRIEKARQVLRHVCFYSPADGVLTDIALHQKSRINAGAVVLSVDNLSSLWLDIQVYENQLPLVHEGQITRAKIAEFPGKTFMGKIIFIDPFENSYNHTTTVRAVLNNSARLLRPGMYALASIYTQPINRAILAPRQAIIHTGTGELAFVEVSSGHFDPVTVQTGLNGEHGLVQILSGLLPGEKVVTSGQFMIDVESQLNQIEARFVPQLSSRKPATSARKRKSIPDKAGGVMPGTKPSATMPKGMKM